MGILQRESSSAPLPLPLHSQAAARRPLHQSPPSQQMHQSSGLARPREPSTSLLWPALPRERGSRPPLRVSSSLELAVVSSALLPPNKRTKMVMEKKWREA